MKNSSYVAVTLLALLVSRGRAEDRGAGDLGKAQSGKAPAGRIAVSTSDWRASNTLRQVLATEYTIAPRTTVFFAWQADLSGSEHVGISITTLSDPRSSL